MGLSDLGKKLSKLGQDTKNGVQKMSDSVSISNRIASEKKSLERLFASIGEAVYKDAPDTPKPGLEDEWAAVKVAYSNIDALTEQLNHVKGIIYCPNCGRPAAKGDKYCAKCGYHLENLQQTTGDKMAQDLKEAGQEVGKIAGDTANRTGEFVGGAAAQTQNTFSKLKEGAAKLFGGKKKKGEKGAQESASQAAEEVKENVSRAAEEVRESASQAAEEMKEKAAQAEEALQDTAAQTAEAMQEPVSQAAEAVNDAVEDMFKDPEA